jgi:hypothetical protein
MTVSGDLWPGGNEVAGRLDWIDSAGNGYFGRSHPDHQVQVDVQLDFGLKNLGRVTAAY